MILLLRIWHCAAENIPEPRQIMAHWFIPGLAGTAPVIVNASGIHDLIAAGARAVSAVHKEAQAVAVRRYPITRPWPELDGRTSEAHAATLTHIAEVWAQFASDFPE